MRRLMLFCSVALAILQSSQSLAARLPPGNSTIVDNFALNAKCHSPGSYYATCTRYKTDGQDVLEVNVTAVQSNPYDIGVDASNLVQVSDRDIGIVLVEVRSSVEQLPVTFSFQRQVPPNQYSGGLDAYINVSTTWQQYSLPFRFKYTSSPGEARLQMTLGYRAPAVIQIRGGAVYRWPQSSGLTAQDLPVCCNFSYPGRDPQAPWREAAQERIQRVRRGSVRVTVKRKDTGEPVPGALVTVNQKNHAFRHGTCVDASVISGVEQDVPYMEVLEGKRGASARGDRMFNTVVFEGDMKWPPWENNKTQQHTLEAYAWLKYRDYFVRMHNLVWPGSQPGHLPQYILDEVSNGTAPSRVMAQIKRHILDEAGRSQFQGGGVQGIDDIDVVNEPFSNHLLQDFFNDSNRCIATWLQVAKVANPGARLRINDAHSGTGTTQSDHFPFDVQLYTELLGKYQAPLEGAGFESHLSWNGVSIPQLIDRMTQAGALAMEFDSGRFDEFDEHEAEEDRFVEFSAEDKEDFVSWWWKRWQLPGRTVPAEVAARPEVQRGMEPLFTVRITEHDMHNPDGELGADVVRDMLTACFASPVCDGFLTWGFSDERSWVGNAPFFLANYTEKPAAAVYRHLLFEEWFTVDENATAGQGGEASVGVWQGVHEVRATSPDGGLSGNATVVVPQFFGGTVTVDVVVD